MKIWKYASIERCFKFSFHVVILFVATSVLLAIRYVQSVEKTFESLKSFTFHNLPRNQYLYVCDMSRTTIFLVVLEYVYKTVAIWIKIICFSSFQPSNWKKQDEKDFQLHRQLSDTLKFIETWNKVSRDCRPFSASNKLLVIVFGCWISWKKI